MAAERSLSSKAKWLLLLALGVAPALFSLATFDVAFHRAESLTFCASCHTMTPWVADLKDPQSKALAALHYRNRYIVHDQCYTCHVDYDFLGPVRAKLDGMHHVLVYYTGLGRHSKIAMYKPFPNSNCLQCHEESAKYKDSPAHAAVADQIKTQQLRCLDCHGPIHTPQGV